MQFIMPDNGQNSGGNLGSAIAAPLVSGAMGLLGGYAQYEWNKKLAAQQNQYNLDMWRMQADYNSPQSQMRRYEQAGLNPNLIYGQGSNGNMTSAPQMVTPQAPEMSEDMRKIAEAFNVENLRTLVANRIKAQEEARLTELQRFDKEDERDALARFQDMYYYDMVSGRYVPYRDLGVSVTASNPRGSRTGDRFTGAGRLSQILGSADPRMFYLNQQRAYLAPQIWMANYDKEHYPITYWMGQASRGIHAASDIVSMVTPARWVRPVKNFINNSRRFVAPNGKFYYY